MSYAETIAQFAHYLLDETAPHDRLIAAERMRHYRANCRLNRIASLQATFSTVNQLLGDDFFRAMAREYVDATPANSANLHAMGADLPAFIAQFPPASDLPYLADIARLDWARWQAYFALGLPALQMSDLANLANADFATLRLIPHPSMQLVQSLHWPIADILAMHQGGPPADLSRGGQQILLSRQRWQALSLGQWALLSALATGELVGDALEAALKIEPHIDINPVLLWLFTQDLVLRADRGGEVCDDKPPSVTNKV